MQIKCTQCGGAVPIEEESDFLRCPFCNTALYVETDRTVRHYAMDPQVSAADLAPIIQRKLAHLEIPDPVQVTGSKLRYFPFWRFETETGATFTVPAAAPPLEEMARIKSPAGDLKLFSPDLAATPDFVEPEYLLEDATDDARQLNDLPDAVFPVAALLHLPLHDVSYLCQDTPRRAVVEAVSGEVYADDWPAGPQKKKDRVLGRIALLTFALFLLEAAFLPGFWLVLAAYALTGTGVFFLARNTLRRMGW